MRSFITFMFIFTYLTIQAQEDAIAKHFSHLLNDDKFTNAYISPKMFSVMAEKTDLVMDEDVRKMIRTMKGMRVVQRTGVDGNALYKQTTDKLTSAKYEELMSLREKGEQIRFYTMGGSGSRVGELVMAVGGPNRFLLLSMNGDIELSTVSKLSKSLNVQGADLLEKVKK